MKKFSRTKLLAVVALSLSLIAAAAVTMWAGHIDGPVKGFTKTDLATFRAEPRDERFYTEIWFHEMQFPGQSIIVTAAFQLNNMGLSRGYCDVYITVSDKSGKIWMERQTIDPENVKIDKDGFGITAGPHRIELKGDSYRINFVGNEVRASIGYKIKDPSYQQGDGTVRFPDGDFVMHNFPIPWANLSGDLTYNGKTQRLSGVGSMNHDRQVLSPTKYMSSWRAFWLYGDKGTVGIVRASAPDLNGVWTQRLLLAEPGRLRFSSHDYKFESLDPEPVPGGKVPCPQRFRVTAEAGGAKLEGEIKVKSIQEKANLLESYPLVVRKLAEAFISETWSYRFWCDYKFTYTENGETLTLEGTGTGNYIDSLEKK